MNQGKLLDIVKRSLIVSGKRFDCPEFVETNSSLILFAADQAFKTIKEEKGPEYSGIAARHIWLDEEMRINGEITPELYLGIKPLIFEHGEIKIGEGDDSDNIEEYALRMKRLSQSSLVRNMLLSGTYRSEHSVIIAEKIADFHALKLSGWFTPDDRVLMRDLCSLDILKKTIEGDFKMFEDRKSKFIPEATTESRYQRIKMYILKFLKENEDLLKRRVGEGYVVPIHGDFHSLNIFVEDESAYFVDRALRRHLRVNDVIKDPAYLSMELEVFGLKQEKECFLNAYQQKLKDPDFEKLLPFYISRLGFVAGMVNLHRGIQCKPYFDVACKYAEI